MLFLPPFTRETIYLKFGFLPEEGFLSYTLLTNLFLHGSLLHVIGNMYFLWFFGIPLEERLGKIKFLLLYLSCGIAGNIIHALASPTTLSDIPCIGASGAISGLMGAFSVYFPQVTLRCLWIGSIFVGFFRLITVNLPAIVFVGLWFVFQFLNALVASPSPEFTNVAYWAHVGGFLFGICVCIFTLLKKEIISYKLEIPKSKKISEALEHAQYGNWKRTCEILSTLHTRITEDIYPLYILSSFLSGKEKLGKETLIHYWKKAYTEKNPSSMVNAYFLSQALGEQILKTPEDFLSLGRSFLKLKDFIYGLKILKEGISQYPESKETPFMLYEIGDALREMGEKEKAKEFFQYLVKNYPGTTVAKSAEFWLGSEF